VVIIVSTVRSQTCSQIEIYLQPEARPRNVGGCRNCPKARAGPWDGPSLAGAMDEETEWPREPRTAKRWRQTRTYRITTGVTRFE